MVSTSRSQQEVRDHPEDHPYFSRRLTKAKSLESKSAETHWLRVLAWLHSNRNRSESSSPQFPGVCQDWPGLEVKRLFPPQKARRRDAHRATSDGESETLGDHFPLNNFCTVTLPEARVGWCTKQ
ncbi:hypothetical protein ElyMa_001629400 [Elysia marginata]|uniref:Uncharacterized protein n=1 Tax=Elysia marginata TaxID=1093978 RepID=A0AAV4JKV2_9GAST|nr:hypothetical protein ElyMa_001629400 [Elysia marginata]